LHQLTEHFSLPEFVNFMAKPKPAPSPSLPAPEPRSSWRPVVVAGILGGLAGATGAYLILRSGLNAPAAPATAPAAIVADDPASRLPTPDLTAGQPPPQAERTLGNFYYDHQNWSAAAQHYEAAIKLGTDDPDIRTDLGNAYRFSNRADDALAQYQLAQKMNPAHESSLFNQGGLYLEQFKQPLKAIETWNEYLRRFPQGENVAATRQLIAQAQGNAAGFAPPASPAAPAPVAAVPAASSSEALILQRIKSAQTVPAKP
jgi:tetratricopeptide (TPR) repeat protein